MAVALVAGPDVALEDLASEVNRQHELCVAAALTSLQHAVLAGRALHAAKDRVERGRWEEWVATNCPDVARMSRPYMRLAAYEGMLPPQMTSATEALRLLRGLPAFDGTGPSRHPPGVRKEAMRLVDEGMSDRQIAQALGIDRKCIRRWAGRGVHQSGSGGARERAAAAVKTGRPSRKDAEARRVRLAEVQNSYGPSHLLLRFKAVAEAQRKDGTVNLRAALLDLAEAAAAWAARL